MKSPEEKAEEYLSEQFKAKGYASVIDAYTAGHAAARAEAAELVEVCEKVANNIGMDALQTEYEPGWMAPEHAVKTIEMTQRLQRGWFTELKKALANYKRGRE